VGNRVAILKSDEIRNMPEVEIRERLTSLREELASEKSAMALGSPPQNPGRIREMRRTIARILTILGEISEEKGATNE
jgi:large subunit ribosomal protein L29